MNTTLRSLIAITGLWVVLPLVAADKDDSKLSRDEQAILDLTNKARAKEKLPALKPNAKLMEAARNHSKNMARQKKLEHVLDDMDHSERVAKTGYRIAGVAENVAAGVNTPPRAAFDLWMNSEQHRANILGDYEHIGIGLARDDNGAVYYTQVFANERSARSQSKDEKRFQEAADRILELTNQARLKEGRKPLKMNPLLTRAAQGHSENMGKQDKLDHVLDDKGPSDRILAAGYKFSYNGENVAYSSELDPKETFEGWMNSPPHKKNILGENFTEIGIALARNNKGEVYYTQVFGTPR